MHIFSPPKNDVKNSGNISNESWKMLLFSIFILCCSSSLAFDCEGFISYERTLGSSLKNSEIGIISEKNITQKNKILSYPCFEECLQSNCLSFEIDYDKRICRLFSVKANENGDDLQETPGVHYFEKLCLSVKIKKSWAIDRSVGLRIHGAELKTVYDVTSRQLCADLCLNETTVGCLSALYDFDAQKCILNDRNKRTVLEKSTTASNINYLENQDRNVDMKCQFKKTEKQSIVYSQSEVIPSLTYEQCEKQCLAEKHFNCRSFNYDPTVKHCSLSADDMSTVGKDTLQPSMQDYYEEGKCTEVQIQCNAKSMSAIFKFDQPFKGKIFSKTNPTKCVVHGKSAMDLTLELPLGNEDCGVKQVGNGTYLSSVTIQHHPYVIRLGDMNVDLSCNYDLPEQVLVKGVGVPDVKSNRTATNSVPTPRATLRITNVHGEDVSSVRLGEKVYLKIETNDSSNFGILIKNLEARSGNDKEMVSLLDSDGCPADRDILRGVYRIDESNSLEASIEVFKFESDPFIKFVVTVAFCSDECELPSCLDGNETSDSLVRRKRSSADKLTNGKKEKEETVVTVEKTVLVSDEDPPIISRKPIQIRRKGDSQIIESGICMSSTLLIGIGVALIILQMITLTLCVICALRNRNRPLPEWSENSSKCASDIKLYAK